MIRCKQWSQYGRRVHVVRLEGPEEHAMSDADLITLVDSMNRDEFERRRKASHPGHFGGMVEKRPGRKVRQFVYARVTVYID